MCGRSAYLESILKCEEQFRKVFNIKKLQCALSPSGHISFRLYDLDTVHANRISTTLKRIGYSTVKHYGYMYETETDYTDVTLFDTVDPEILLGSLALNIEKS